MINLNRFRVTATAAFALLIFFVNSAFAAEDLIFKGRGDFAINGYDSVAYHLEMQPVEGDGNFTAEWKGAVWRFKNLENRDLFQSDPERWAPKYGGYCAYAVANNAIAKTDPIAWSIVDDRLYLNFNLNVREKWREDAPGNISRADANWPGVLNN